MTEEIMTEASVHSEEVTTTGDSLLGKVKELVHEGNIRRITIKNEEGETLINIPLTIGVVGSLLAPQLAALGAIAALVKDCTIVIDKGEEA